MENLWEIMILLCLPSLPKYSGIFSIIKVSKGKSQKEGGRENHLGLRERNMLSDFREGKKLEAYQGFCLESRAKGTGYTFFLVHSTMGTYAQGLLWHCKFSPRACGHIVHTCSPHSIIGKSKSHGNEGNDPAVNSSFTLRAHLHLLFIIFSNWKRPSTK